MKLCHILLSVFMLAGIYLFVSCSDTDNGQTNSSMRLLPVKISTDIEASNKRTYTYAYDTSNRLVEYVETSLFGNNIGLEDMETTCKIVYNEHNDIDSLIITPRLLNDFGGIDSSVYDLVNDTVLFEYKGEEVIVRYRNKKDEKIYINSRREVVAYEYYSGIDGLLKITNTYEYDDKGNILKIVINNGVDKPYIPYVYAYDNRNGIFKNVNIPQWFMVIMLDQRFNMANNYKEYSDYDNCKWIMEYSYNKNDYPIFKKTKYEGETEVRQVEALTTFDYTYAN